MDRAPGELKAGEGERNAHSGGYLGVETHNVGDVGHKERDLKASEGGLEVQTSVRMGA